MLDDFSATVGSEINAAHGVDWREGCKEAGERLIDFRVCRWLL